MKSAERRQKKAALAEGADEPRAAMPPVRRREAAQAGISTVSYTALAEKGYEFSAGDAVLPIVRKFASDKELEVIGTGFFVGPDIIITARHILEGEDLTKIACFQILSAIGTYIFRRLRLVIPHKKSDIVLLHLYPMNNGRHELDLLNHVFLIGGPIPSTGTKLTTYAYPDVSTRRYKDRLYMSIAAHHYDGEVLDVFPSQRDSVMLNFPCMRTSTHLHGGASGGPVINVATGAVVGVNTSSFAGATDESYVALIHPILDTPIPEFEYVAGISMQTTLRELSSRGATRVAPENLLVQSKTITITKQSGTTS